MAQPRIPAAPVLNEHILPSVFVHHSHPEPLHGEHGNGERLEVLGARMLRAAYTAALAGMYSFQNDELEVRRLLRGLRTRCADDDWALTVRGRRDM